MKTSKDLFTRSFIVDEKQQHDYEHWVNLTAKLLNKPYFVVHKMVENWPIERIKERYLDATKVDGMPKEVWWYWKRKQDKQSVDNSK